jgi:hypothetical protein
MIHIINDEPFLYKYSEIRFSLLVAGRYNALLSNGHLRDCHVCNGTYHKILASK